MSYARAWINTLIVLISLLACLASDDLHWLRQTLIVALLWLALVSWESALGANPPECISDCPRRRLR